MTRFTSVFCFVLFNAAAWASSENISVDLRYSGFQFNVPSGAEAIGSTGGNDNFLVIRYGPDKGKKYLAFTNMTHDESLEYGCAPAKFYAVVFSADEEAGCNEEQVSYFRRIFLSDDESSVWNGLDAVVYYTGASGIKYLFLVKGGSRLIKIDSDFLSEKELKKVVSVYLD